MQGLSKNQFKYILRLNKNPYFRRKEEKAFVEGLKIIQELQKEVPNLVEYYVVRSGFESEVKNIISTKKVYTIPNALGYRISKQKKFNVGAVIKMPKIQPPSYSLKGLIFGLVSIQDPGNLGTIFRTLLAFDLKNIILFNHCASPYNKKCISSSAGAIFRLNIFNHESIEDYLNDLDFPTYALDIKGKTNYKKLQVSKGLFLFGNEGSGLPKKVLEQSKETVKIPIKNIDSLNVAVSVGIIASHLKSF